MWIYNNNVLTDDMMGSSTQLSGTAPARVVRYNLVDTWSYFLFHPVLRNWYDKDRKKQGLKTTPLNKTIQFW